MQKKYQNSKSEASNQAYSGISDAENTQENNSEIRQSKEKKSKEKNINKDSSSKVKTFDISSNEYKLADKLKQLILENKPDAILPKNLNKWAGTFDLMIRADKRDPKTIWHVMVWCQKDDFWRVTILSPDKLRKQFDALELQMKQKKEKESAITPYSDARVG